MGINNIALENEIGKLAKARTPTLGNGCIDKQDTTLAKDLADIVKNHALGAAAAGIGIAWAPGWAAPPLLLP